MPSGRFASARRKAPSDLAAYDLYALAGESFRKGTSEGFAEAIKYNDGAIAADPHFSGAYVSKAWSVRWLALAGNGDFQEAMSEADTAMYAQKNSGRATAGRQSTDVLLRALTEHHPHLGDHLNGVTELVQAVAHHLNIEGDQFDQLRDAAALHDIGKIAIPDSIINKAAELNPDEWGLMRQHTLIGERIVGSAPALRGAAPLVRSSHEAFDGSGYPDGLVGDAIPLGARIIAVCDAFDAMISNRSYSRARTIDAALAELQRCAGTQFDPTIVTAFERVMVQRHQTPTQILA